MKTLVNWSVEDYHQIINAGILGEITLQTSRYEYPRYGALRCANTPYGITCFLVMGNRE